MLKNYFDSKLSLLPQLKFAKTIRLFLIVLGVFLFANNMIAQTTIQAFPASQTWQCPAGVTSITVEAWGGGAGGQGGVGSGGGGAFAGNNSIAVTPGVDYKITVGVGGTIGFAGGDSSIALLSTPTVFLVMAEGGGKAGSTLTGGRASASFGASGLVWSGGNGIVGTYFGGGGGGGSAGAGGDGGNGFDSVNEKGGFGGFGGAAGTGTAGAVGGRGGSKDPQNRDGYPGITPGSGGGEKYYKQGNDANSGVGARGQVIISYVTPPTITTAASAASVCSSGSMQTTSLSYSATTGSPTTYSITWNGSPVNAFVPVTDTALPASPIMISLPANTTAGTYTGTLTVKRANGNYSTGTTFTITVNPPPPATTGVAICPGGTGSLTATTLCSSGYINSGTSITGSWTAGTDLVAKRPGALIVNTSTCSFDPSITRNYVKTDFQVSVTGTYSLLMNDNTSYDGMGYITSGAFVVGNCSGGGTWIKGDDDSSSVDNEPLITASLNAGTTYTLISTTYGSASGTISGAFAWTITPPSGGQIMLNSVSTLDWYTVASGGTKIGSDSPFNPVGVAGSGLADTNTPGTFTYYAACSGNTSCRTATNFVINAVPTAPQIGTITHPDCTIATGSAVLNGLPATGTWNLFQNGNATPIVSGGTGTTYTVSGLAVGNHTFTVSKGTCTSVASSSVGVIAPVTATWNVVAGTGTWTNGPPTIAKALVFNGNYPLPPDMEGCSCQVNSGAVVTFKSGSTLKITNGVTVDSGGSLTFENNASLVQINDAAVNTGNITYLRQSTFARSTDYTYWSSPVAGQQLTNVSTKYLSGLFYSFTSGNWSWETPSNVMVKGKGYIMRGPQTNNPPSFYDGTFTGTPHNGTVNIAIGAAGTFNLIGNPYPSAIDADKFLNDNSGTLMGTIYIWTHNTAIQLASNITNGTAGSGVYAYTSDDYASYNGVGGIATSGGTIPSGKIAAGQSFFATSRVPGNAIINNSMRVDNFGAALNNSQFFKTASNSKAADAAEKHRLWLNLTNNQGAFKQTLVGYLTGATNGFDDRFDGQSFDSNAFVDFYSVNQNKKLVIQGRSLPFETTDSVPLGYKSTITGAFTISIGQIDGLLANQAVFIEDKLTNTKFDLKSGNYTFNTEKGVFDDRFILSYANKTLGTNDFNVPENQILVSNKNKQIKINSFLETIDEVLVYDITGRQLYHKTKVDSNELTVSNLASSHQALIVKVVLQNGQTLSKKIIY